MARRRLRHKLMLGLVLVAGSVGLLVFGTCYGIYGYYTSVKTTERKLEELQIVTLMIKALNAFEQPGTNGHEHYLVQIESTKAQLAWFNLKSAGNVNAGLDPDGGEMENGLVPQLTEQLKVLEAAVAKAHGPGTHNEVSPGPLHQHQEVRPAHEKARLTAENLRQALVDDIQTSCRESKAAITRTIFIVGFAVLWALALVGTMLYYFRVWMFTPIRELQAGVQRVHGGNFDQPIVLTSGDELQELADEFNAMIARLHAVYADLARQVNERSRQLVRSERMVSVGFLAAGVAHEINNPLASILFCSEALERRLQEVLTALNVSGSSASPAEAEVLARYLKMIQQEALRCKDITQKLLDFSRTGDRRKDPADLTGIVRGVLEVARHLPIEPRQAGGVRAGRVHRRPGERAGPQECDSEPRRERARQYGRRRSVADHARHRGRVRGAGVQRHRLRDVRGRTAEHLRAVLHEEPHGEGHRAGAVHQPPDRGPARRHDHRDERRPRTRQHVHRAHPASARAGGADCNGR